MTWAIENKGYSQRRACDLVGMASRVYRYRPTRPNDAGLRKGLREQPCALRNRRRRRSLSSISLSRSAIAASRSAMAVDANARSASISSGSESAGRSTQQAQHVTGDLPAPKVRLIHFTTGYCTAWPAARSWPRSPALCATDDAGGR